MFKDTSISPFRCLPFNRVKASLFFVLFLMLSVSGCATGDFVSKVNRDMEIIANMVEQQRIELERHREVIDQNEMQIANLNRQQKEIINGKIKGPQEKLQQLEKRFEMAMGAIASGNASTDYPLNLPVPGNIRIPGRVPSTESLSVYFDTDSVVAIDTHPVDIAIERLKKQKDLIFGISGWSDTVGKTDQGLRVAFGRAVWTYEQLISNGIDQGRVAWIKVGVDKNPEKWKARRVDVELFASMPVSPTKSTIQKSSPSQVNPKGVKRSNPKKLQGNPR